MIRRLFCFLISALLLIPFAGCSLFSSEPEDSTTDSGTDRTWFAITDLASNPETDSDSVTDSQSDGTSGLSTTHDILKTPISQLTADEQDQLAEYLFEKYIPCSYGIFTDARNLSSSSVWSSVEALNRAVDGDESEASRKLENVLKKVEIYYPDTEFDASKVRVYDANTKTFAPSPADTSEYAMLSYEVKGDEIVIHYENKPDQNDPDGDLQQYATTLKNSPTEGYFTFVSTVKTGAVG